MLGNLQFAGDQVGEDPDTFRMAPGRPVMHAQRQAQLDQLLHRAGILVLAFVQGALQTAPQVAGVATAARHRESPRGVIREEQREVEERREWQQAPGDSLQDDQRQQ